MSGIWDKLCGIAPLLKSSLALVLALLFLSLFTFPAVTPGSETYYISLINLALLGCLLVFHVVVLFVCKRVHTEDLEGKKELEVFDDQ
ncbi:hypothetical protein [Natrarchaeobius chitinivorans]|uniref:Uncharacterized protein n=1 Tax=Natrarchaeobius chitinivorans TaxID=1679083 RepID=A0A3N6P5X3_NATCH|nr:hypothetical protein [Natrarchaeobius chitinivorans]RQG93619.1 hypothetical protein EA473_14945 [Natrarchaeobius chitinivorans]